jgi:hypothetical protein
MTDSNRGATAPDQEATAEPPWWTLSEAAARTGLDRETIRSRARRGLYPSRKSNQGQVLVQVPTGEHAGPDHGNDQEHAGEVTALREAVADLTAELTEVRVALARSEAGTTAAIAQAWAEGEAHAARAEAEARAKDTVILALQEQLRDLRQPWWRRWAGRRSDGA